MTRDDVIAGVPGAISSVPDGMAAGVLAGVSPVHGLYASMAGPFFGGFASSTTMMVIATTSASALAAGSALSSVPAADREAALILLTVIAGAVMLIAAVLKLGRYTRFVSHSVMTGFLTGVSANIVFGQISDFTGAPAHGSVSIAKAFDVIVHPGRVDWHSLLVGLTAVALLVVLARTRLAMVSSLLALAVPTALVLLCGWDSVARVADAGAIPAGIPLPQLPDPRVLTPSLVSGACAVAVIVLVQGAGVAEAAPNPDRTRSSSDRDFTAQGIGNIAAGLFRGMPVGGSVGQTAINTAAGARTRWAAIWSGLWMLAILAAFAGSVGRVPMPTLSAVLIVAAVGSFRVGDIVAIWSSGRTSRIALLTTFLGTLLLPVTEAVGVGVALSLLLQLNQEAMDLKVVRLRVDDGRLVEADLPKQLHDNEIAIIDVYGSMFFAGSRTLQARLPDPAHAHHPVVILRIRGRTTLGATFFAVLADYAQRLDERDGHLYLSGVDRQIRDHWTPGRLAAQGLSLDFFPATDTIGESTLTAYAQAKVRLLDTAD
ncbi:SulP family inorganic anion transporter [Nocardia sp. NPDC052254]|uniref:SulP family inorganic anion transporter n=1 Tax=Nocardia sp. NPDC052254 TaxID=3155681 RepID=UPI00343ACEC9